MKVNPLIADELVVDGCSAKPVVVIISVEDLSSLRVLAIAGKKSTPGIHF